MDRKKTVTINGAEYTVRKATRAYFYFEEITGKPFSLETMLDNYLFIYCILLACNPDTPLQWDDFMDAVDRDDSLITDINSILTDAAKVENLLENEAADDGDKKKG